MQLMQSLAELRTHDNPPQIDDLAKALEYYGARIGRDLGRLHELTEGKIAVGAIVEMATIYEHLVSTDDIPDETPEDFFNDVLIPAMDAELTKEEVTDDICITGPSESPQG